MTPEPAPAHEPDLAGVLTPVESATAFYERQHECGGCDDCTAAGRLLGMTPEWAQRWTAQQWQNLGEAVKDVCWRAVQYGETEDGDTYAYLVTKGAMHRLIGAAQAAGVAAAFRAEAGDV